MAFLEPEQDFRLFDFVFRARFEHRSDVLEILGFLLVRGPFAIGGQEFAGGRVDDEPS